MVQINKWIIGIVFVILITNVLYSDDGWRVSAGVGLTQPVGPLHEWFNNGSQFHFSVGQVLDNGWLLEGLIEHARYNKENLSGYPKDKLDLYLEHVAIWASGKYDLYCWSSVSYYLAIAGGPLYWKGIRGEIEANESLAIPYIDKKVLEEWNMGFRAGFGSTISFGPVGVDALLTYRFVVGNLWPTMQEYIELDGVNGFHFFNIDLGLFYTF